MRTPTWKFDVFISYARADAAALARALADVLETLGLRVWIDRSANVVGGALPKSIDEGIRLSRRAVVVLSPAYFKSGWATWELDALIGRHIEEGGDVIIPVWHNLSVIGVREHNLSLATITAISTEEGLESVLVEILRGISREDLIPKVRENAEARRMISIMEYIIDADRSVPLPNANKIAENRGQYMYMAAKKRREFVQARGNDDGYPMEWPRRVGKFAIGVRLTIARVVGILRQRPN